MSENLIELGEIRPDAMIVATRVTEIAPLAGRPAIEGTVIETLHVLRYDKIVTLTLPGVAPLAGDLVVLAMPDVEIAEVEFTNLVDVLRRDGWTLRDPEPWESVETLSEEAPF
jgi:hypothetical protein